MKQELRSLARRIFQIAGNINIQAFLRVKRGALVRFTNNGIHQNGFQDLFSYTLRLITKEGPVWAESNDLTEAGIRDALKRLKNQRGRRVAIQAKSRERVTLQRSGRKKESFPLSLEKIPGMAGQAIERAVRLIRGEQASANGYYSAYQRFFYLAEAGGVEAFHPSSSVRFGVTVTRGAGKGYFSFYHPDPKRLNVTHVVREASELAEEACREEVVLKPGEYECIFHPRAFLELIEPLRRHFDSHLCSDGKSVLSGLLGKKIFSEEFSMFDDQGHPLQFGLPFDAEGAGKRKVLLVEKGKLKEFLSEGHSTRGFLEHPFYPTNLVVKNGRLSRADFFKRIKRGIFINKIWYHTLVRESEMEVTGLATAGSLFIEQGQIRGRVSHLRYHDSLFSILRSVVGSTKEQILLKDGETGAALFPYLWVSRLRVV